MTLTLCGGGNLGHVIAAFAAHRGYDVQLLTRHPERWNCDISIDTPDGKVITGRISRISNQPSAVIPQADMVLLCLPGYAIGDCLTAIAPHLSSSTPVGSVVSSTGFFFEALEKLPATTPLFGFQRVPFIARTGEYGRSAHLLGYKPQLHVAYISRYEVRGARCEDTQERSLFFRQLEQLFDTEVVPLGSHYEASLTNSNPLLHTSRLYSMWHTWHEGTVYPTQNRFYADWTDEASALLIAMDREFFQLLDVLPVRPGSIPTILDYYESCDAPSLTRKLRSIPAFQDILSPMEAVAGGFVPDFHSRYFTEDFPYGLAIVRRLMQEHAISAPHIEQVFLWGMSVCK